MSDEMDEIWELYADDGTQALDAMEVALEALMDADGAPEPHIAALFRAVHTFKGNSRVLGLAVVESRAHLAEDLIGLVRDSGVALTGEILDGLMETGDHLRRMLDETARTRSDVDPAPSEKLAERLRSLIAASSGAADDGAHAVAGPEVAAPAAEALPESPAPKAKGGAKGRTRRPAAKAADPAPAPEPAPEPGQEPAPEPAPETGEATGDATGDATDPAGQAGGLVLDPGYRTIFLDMVDSTLAELDALRGGDATGAAQAVDGLAYAAGQLGLGGWSDALAACMAEGVTPDGLVTLIDTLRDLRARDFGQADPKVDDTPEAALPTPALTPPLFAELDKLFARIADIGLKFAQDERPDPQVLLDISTDIAAVADPMGYVRVTQAAQAFATARDNEQFQNAQLDFYEELAAVERSLPQGSAAALAIRPTEILLSWSADHIFEILTELRQGLETPTRSGAAGWFPGFERLMRRAFHACQHFKMDTAGQLTMALVDLVARGRMEDRAPDVILIQIARGFVDTMELVFDTLDQGDMPDIARIEQLFEEAATVSFLASGVVSARVIEQKLGLPAEFHRVLSPESVKAAQSALEAGLRFYVVRADLNGDDAMAEGFLNWLSAGKIRMITNVTVFKGDITLFDFLLAAPLGEDRVIEALVQLDPAGARISLMQALVAVDEPEGGGPEHADLSEEQGGPAGFSGLDSLRFIETIGEMSAGQAMVASMLDTLAASDLSRDLQVALRHAGLPQPDPAMRGILRDLFETHLGRLRQINEAQIQLNTQLAALQEQSVAMRSQPADVLLKPLQAFVSTQARALGHSARLSIGGGEVMLDQAMIEQMRAVLKRLLTLRLAADPAPRKLHIAVSRREDQMRIEMSDDGEPSAGAFEIASIGRELERQRGTLRRALPPDGGLRLHISVPLHMIALEGMVVRVGDIHYVLPIETIQRIHQGNALMSVAAADRRQMLRLTESELVPVHALPRSQPGSTVSSPVAEIGGAVCTEGLADDLGAAGDGLYVIVHTPEQDQLAIPVDELLGQQLVLLRPLQGVLVGLRDMSGVAILSGGQVGVVVSVSRLAEAA